MTQTSLKERPAFAYLSFMNLELLRIDLQAGRDDHEDVRQTVAEFGYTAHIKSRDQEESERKSRPTYRARRWVVERTHSWMNRFRRLLIRWEMNITNYTALLHLACAYICLNAAGVFGQTLSSTFAMFRGLVLD